MPGGDSRDEVLEERAFDGPVDKHGDIPPITDVKHMVPESRPTEATCLDSSIHTRSEMGVNVIGIGSPGGWIIDNLEVPLRIRTNGIANRHG